MANHSNSYHFIWDFWEKKILEMHKRKKSKFVLDFGGKNLKEKLKECPSFLQIKIFVNDVFKGIYEQATEDITPYPGWDDLFDKLPVDGGYKSFLEEYSKAKDDTIEDFHFELEFAFKDIEKYEKKINKILGATTLPHDWTKQLVKKSDLDAANTTIATLTTERDSYKTKSNEYDRIHTKLNGKVSDSELNNLLNPPLPCSQTDYDTIKQERDQLKTENTTLLEKINAELGLDKNSSLEQIINKIKELTKTPDTTELDQLKRDKQQLVTQLAEKEKTITNLQQQNKSSGVLDEEVKTEIIKESKELGLFSEKHQVKLMNVKSYQELSRIQNEAFKEKLLEKENSLQKIQSNTEKIKISLLILIVLMVLLAVGRLGYYISQKRVKSVRNNK